MDDKGKGFKGENISEFILRLKTENSCQSITRDEFQTIMHIDKGTKTLSEFIDKLLVCGFSEFKAGMAIEVMKRIREELTDELGDLKKRKIVINIVDNIDDDNENLAALAIDLNGVDRIEFCKIINIINQRNKEGIKNDLLELKGGALGLGKDKQNKLLTAMLAKGLMDLSLDEKRKAEALEKRRKAFGSDNVDSSKDNKNDNNKNGEKK